MKQHVAIIDADLIGRKRHRFPNLASMKLSAYYKDLGCDVVLKTDYEDLDHYDRVFLSKVFTDTEVPAGILERENVMAGGTGFFYDKAPALPEVIEHHWPDYHLYDEWVRGQMAQGKKRSEFKFYLDYSIGYLTRGCFRQCPFCVNRNYKRVQVHSPLMEFYDASRKKICLLDDNFLGSGQWRRLLLELQHTHRPFQFRQGLDERLLSDVNCPILFSSVYDGDFMFAFDNYADAAKIERNIQIARRYSQAIFKFYCFTGFDRADHWDGSFWVRDIFELFYRIQILMKYRCIPYVMRFNRYVESPYRGMYITLARWCNQPAFFKKKSLREFGILNGKGSATSRYLREFEARFPNVSPFYDMKFEGEIHDEICNGMEDYPRQRLEACGL